MAVPLTVWRLGLGLGLGLGSGLGLGLGHEWDGGAPYGVAVESADGVADGVALE